MGRGGRRRRMIFRGDGGGKGRVYERSERKCVY